MSVPSPISPGPLSPPRPPRKPPVLLLAVLAAGCGLGLWLEWLGSGWVTALSARVDGTVVNASTRMPGTLTAVLVEEGARVKANQPVATLADDDVRAAVLEAEADLAGAQAGLAASRTGVKLAGSQTLNNVAQAQAQQQALQAALTAAEAAVGQAEADFRRLKGLLGGGYISGQELETARVTTITTRAELAAAHARVRGAEEAVRHARATGAVETVRRDTLDLGAAQLRRAEAQVALARLRLKAVAIQAPIDGLVVRRLAEPGEPVALGQPVVAIIDPAKLWVTASLDEWAAPRVATGAAAVLRFDALPGRRFEGHVAFVSAVTEDATTAHALPNAIGRLPPRVAVRVTLDTSDPRLRPGMTATVRIQAER